MNNNGTVVNNNHNGNNGEDDCGTQEEGDLRWRQRIELFNKKLFRQKKLEPKDLILAINGVMSQHDCIVGIDTDKLPSKKELCYLIPAASEKGVSVVIFPHKSEIAPFQDAECGLSALKEREEANCALGVPTAIWGGETKDKLVQDLTNRQPQIKLLYVLGLRCIKNANFLELIDKIHKAGHLQRFCLEKVEYLRDNYEALESVQMLLRQGRSEVPLVAIASSSEVESDGTADFQDFAADMEANLGLGESLQFETFRVGPDDGRKTSPEEEVLHKCDYCFHVGEKDTCCSFCTEVYYCDRACQKAGWARHKDQCRHFFPASNGKGS